MKYKQGQKVRLSRDTYGTPSGSVCMVHRAEGLGNYILRGPLGSEETERRLFAATEDDLAPMGEEAQE